MVEETGSLLVFRARSNKGTIAIINLNVESSRPLAPPAGSEPSIDSIEANHESEVSSLAAGESSGAFWHRLAGVARTAYVS